MIGSFSLEAEGLASTSFELAGMSYLVSMRMHADGDDFV